MNEVLTLLRPRLISLKNGGHATNKNARLMKLLLLGTVGVLFWGGLFAISWRVLYYFKGIEEIGDILGFKLLSMIFITSFALLIFSSILTSLSKLFLSRDLFLIHSLPISTYKLFTARWIDSTVDSSWMVIIYTLPVFIAYGIVYQGGPLFYITIFLTLVALSITASAISTLLVICAVVVVPASRMKNIFVFLSILFFVILYISIRFLQPELLVDPEVFDSVLVYITALKTSSSPFLPSTWAYDALEAALIGSTSDVLFHSALSWSFAGMMVVLIIILADAVYFKGFSKTQTAQMRLVKHGTIFGRVFRILPGPIKAFVEKEIKTFFRDQTQWSQLFLIAALVVIYIYNFNVLPLEKSPIKTVYLQNLLSFLNMGLALFVLTAITGRFAFPAVSAEKNAFWLVKSSPSPLKNFLWIKFVIYYLPLLILSEILIVATNILLQVTPFMMALSTVTVFFLVPGIVSMGIGLGAAYPDFKAENPAQTVTSYGGLVFMILCASYIGIVIIAQAGPVHKLFMADIHNRSITALGWAWIIASFALTFILSITAILLPMKFGEKRLTNMLT
jgi:ABC-2 type transport system permease protein